MQTSYPISPSFYSVIEAADENNSMVRLDDKAQSKVTITGVYPKVKRLPVPGDLVTYCGCTAEVVNIEPLKDYSFKSRKTWTRQRAFFNRLPYHIITFTIIEPNLL